MGLKVGCIAMLSAELEQSKRFQWVCFQSTFHHEKVEQGAQDLLVVVSCRL